MAASHAAVKDEMNDVHDMHTHLHQPSWMMTAQEQYWSRWGSSCSDAELTVGTAMSSRTCRRLTVETGVKL
jgi:hypothetical protein